MELEFEIDSRHQEPNATGHRRSRFREGWRHATAGKRYKDEALRELTWQNLGWRLGKLFGSTETGLVDALYDWCVDQQEVQLSAGSD